MVREGRGLFSPICGPGRPTHRPAFRSHSPRAEPDRAPARPWGLLPRIKPGVAGNPNPLALKAVFHGNHLPSAFRSHSHVQSRDGDRSRSGGLPQTPWSRRARMDVRPGSGPGAGPSREWRKPGLRGGRTWLLLKSRPMWPSAATVDASLRGAPRGGAFRLLPPAARPHASLGICRPVAALSLHGSPLHSFAS